MVKGNRKPNLSERAYEQIKDALCKGKIAAGDILSESQLAEELDMSRTPVREALRILASEGWVEIRRGIGAYVKALSSKDMEDLYEVRCLLETLAIKTSVFNISNQEINSLETRFRACLNSSPPDPRQFSDLDWELHELIVERCQNNYLKTILRNNYSSMKQYQLLSFEALNDIKESTLQHLNILSLMRQRDVGALADTLLAHLKWASGLIRFPQ
ncbi:GntR family transcriptional regulator [Oscillospiraceae bacterium 50-58]